MSEDNSSNGGIKVPGEVKVVRNTVEKRDDISTLLLYLNKESKLDLAQATQSLARKGFTNTAGRQLRQNDIVLWILTKGIEVFNNEYGHLGAEFKISDPNY